MKFDIPDLNTLIIECPEKRYSPYYTISIKKCSNCPIRENKCLNYIVERIKNILKILCDNNNEKKFCEKEKCENCNYTYIRAVGGFLCEECGTLFSLTDKELKNILKEDFEEIDKNELKEKIEQFIIKYKLSIQIKNSNKETLNFIEITKNPKEENNIIQFKNKKE